MGFLLRNLLAGGAAFSSVWNFIPYGANGEWEDATTNGSLTVAVKTIYAEENPGQYSIFSMALTGSGQAEYSFVSRTDSAAFTNIVWNGTYFIFIDTNLTALENVRNHRVYRSLDGIVWEEFEPTLPTPPYEAYGIKRLLALSSGRIIAFAGGSISGSPFTSLIRYSDDNGETWTIVQSPAWVEDPILATRENWVYPVVDNLGRILVYGGGRSVIISTDNGETWSRSVVSGLGGDGASVSIESAAYGNGAVVLTGYDDTTDYIEFIARSTDGINFTKVLEGTATPTATYLFWTYDMRFINGSFYYLGDDGASSAGNWNVLVRKSEDGITFTDWGTVYSDQATASAGPLTLLPGGAGVMFDSGFGLTGPNEPATTAGFYTNRNGSWTFDVKDEPTFVGVQASSDSVATTDHIIGLPASIAVGQLMIAHLTLPDKSFVAPPPVGWTLVVRANPFSNNACMYIYAKYADAADVSSGSFTWTAPSATTMMGHVYAFDNVIEVPTETLGTLGTFTNTPLTFGARDVSGYTFNTPDGLPIWWGEHGASRVLSLFSSIGNPGPDLVFPADTTNQIFNCSDGSTVKSTTSTLVSQASAQYSFQQQAFVAGKTFSIPAVAPTISGATASVIIPGKSAAVREMKAPIIDSITTQNFNTDTTDHLVTLPTVNAGDRLILVFSNHGGSGGTVALPPGGWVQLATIHWSTDIRLTAFYKDCVGDEGGTTVNLVTPSVEKGNAMVHRIRYGTFEPGIAPEVGPTTGTTGGGAVPTYAEAVSPSWGHADNLYIAYSSRHNYEGANFFYNEHTTGFGLNGDWSSVGTSAVADSTFTLSRWSHHRSEKSPRVKFMYSSSRSYASFTIAVKPWINASTPPIL